MKYLTMWVCELGGYWGWLSSPRFLSLFYSDWPNPKEKTPHILKVTQHQNVYPRSVVDFFSKSCFVLIAFMNVIFKHGNFLQFPLEIWQNLQKNPKKTFLAFACNFALLPQCKNSPKTNH